VDRKRNSISPNNLVAKNGILFVGEAETKGIEEIPWGHL
jgi:hypothetical protein